MLLARRGRKVEELKNNSKDYEDDKIDELLTETQRLRMKGIT